MVSSFSAPGTAGAASDTPPKLRNHILSRLPGAILARLLPDLSHVTLVSGQVMHERGETIDYLYFIESGLASLTAETFDSGAVEVGLTGLEGFVGVAALLQDHPISGQRAFMQIPGDGMRISCAKLTAAVAVEPVLRARCLAYVNLLMNQVAQTAACNARHDVTERLGRWLLMSHDRVDGDVLPLTQEFLSYMLGVRRPGVAVSASALQADGLIQYARGRITVLDRPGLEAAACGCYAHMRQAAADQLAAQGEPAPPTKLAS